MKLIAIILLVLALNGCASIKEVASDTDTFGACKVADVVTTGHALATGRFIEKNVLVAPLVSHGIFPLALISIALWYWIDQEKNDNLTMAANVITCPVAAHNLWLLLK